MYKIQQTKEYGKHIYLKGKSKNIYTKCKTKNKIYKSIKTREYGATYIYIYKAANKNKYTNLQKATEYRNIYTRIINTNTKYTKLKTIYGNIYIYTKNAHKTKYTKYKTISYGKHVYI